jgi:hypothetical protein
MAVEQLSSTVLEDPRNAENGTGPRSSLLPGARDHPAQYRAVREFLEGGGTGAAPGHVSVVVLAEGVRMLEAARGASNELRGQH